MESNKTCHTQLGVLQDQMVEFQKTFEGHATAMFWLNFLEMSDLLHRFVDHQREGNWMGHLRESALMLPFLTAAGHYKYGQQSLPLYLSEMKKLPETAPNVHSALMNGRISDGHHNGVSPDMLLEQTYNGDAKEESGLDGIPLNVAARTKWVYTKSVTAAVSAQLKSMLHLNSAKPHHECGQTRVARDAEMVRNVMAAIETNPFTTTHTSLINISTVQRAQQEVEDHLINVKQLGIKALCASLSGDQTKTSIVKLKTFHTHNAKTKNTNEQPTAPGKSDEVVALLRMTQIIASGGEVDIVDFIGNHECSKIPQSLFNGDGSMMYAGAKANLVKTLKEETNVVSSPCLQNEHRKTAVVVDAMHAIRRWTFHKEEPFGSIATRYRKNLIQDVPAGTSIIHFCSDRYNPKRPKSSAQEHMYAGS